MKDQQAGFDSIIKAIIEAPALSQWRPGAPLVIAGDGSQQAIGGGVYQREQGSKLLRPLFFASKEAHLG